MVLAAFVLALLALLVATFALVAAIERRRKAAFDAFMDRRRRVNLGNGATASRVVLRAGDQVLFDTDRGDRLTAVEDA